MRTNRQAFTLAELMIATLILVSVVMGFYHVIRGTSLFVAANKQELLTFRSVSSIKNEIEAAFLGGNNLSSPEARRRTKAVLAPPSFTESASGSFQTRTYTGSFSYKDDTADVDFGGYFDLVTLDYEDRYLSGSVSETDTGTIMIGVVDKKTRKLIDPVKKRSGFLGIQRVEGGKGVKDYYENSSDTGAVFAERIFDDMNLLDFEYRIIENGSLLRLDFRYDNDLADEFAISKKYDESYLSGSTFVIHPVEFK